MDFTVLKIDLGAEYIRLIEMSYSVHSELNDVPECYMESIKKFLDNKERAWIYGVCNTSCDTEELYEIAHIVLQNLQYWIDINTGETRTHTTGADLILLGEILRIFPLTTGNLDDDLALLPIPAKIGLSTMHRMTYLVIGYIHALSQDVSLTRYKELVADDEFMRTATTAIINTFCSAVSPKVYIDLLVEGINECSNGIYVLWKIVKESEANYPCIDTSMLFSDLNMWNVLMGLFDPDAMYAILTDDVLSKFKKPSQLYVALLIYWALEQFIETVMGSQKALILLSGITGMNKKELIKEFSPNNFVNLKQDIDCIINGGVNLTHPRYNIHVILIAAVTMLLDSVYGFIRIEKEMPWIDPEYIRLVLDDIAEGAYDELYTLLS